MKFRGKTVGPGLLATIAVLCAVTVVGATIIYSNSLTFHQTVSMTPELTLSAENTEGGTLYPNTVAEYLFSVHVPSDMTGSQIGVSISKDGGIALTDISGGTVTVTIGETHYTISLQVVNGKLMGSTALGSIAEEGGSGDGFVPAGDAVNNVLAISYTTAGSYDITVQVWGNAQ